MLVKKIVSREDAVRLSGNPNLMDANERVIDDEETGTLLNVRRQLAPEVAKRLRFVGPKSTLAFDSDTEINNQATRNLRELTLSSAELLDRAIETTDNLTNGTDPLTVTTALLEDGDKTGHPLPFSLPEELEPNATYREGSVSKILVNRYERDEEARRKCIEHYGTVCVICRFDFSGVYGDAMSGFIHVHHLVLLSEAPEGYEVHPVRDLRPVCPNCHAVLHRRKPPYSLDDVRQMLRTGERRTR